MWSASCARQRGVPVIAFSTDANVAARGVYLLSFLPESDVDRIVDFAIAQGKRSFAALMSDGAYGTVVEAAFKQAVARKGGRIVALERYPLDARRCRRRPQAWRRPRRAPTPFSFPRSRGGAGGGAGAGGGRRRYQRVQLLGTGLWDDPRIFYDRALDGGWYRGAGRQRLPHFLGRAIASGIVRTRCARRRWPMMRWR